MWIYLIHFGNKGTTNFAYMQAFGAFSPNKMNFLAKNTRICQYILQNANVLSRWDGFIPCRCPRSYYFFVSRKSFELKIMLTPKFFIAKYIVARKFLCANYGLNTNQIRSIWLVSFCLNFTFVYEKRHRPLHTSNNFCTFAQNLKHTGFGTTENMNKVRITAIRQTVYPDLIAQYENPASSHE